MTSCRVAGWSSGPSPGSVVAADWQKTARILCVKSLTIGSVQFASKSMHLGLLQQPPAQLSRKTAALIKKPHFSTIDPQADSRGLPPVNEPARQAGRGYSR